MQFDPTPMNKKPTIKQIFRANGFRLHRGAITRSGGKQRVTVDEYQLQAGVWVHVGSRTAPKRELQIHYTIQP